MLGAGPGCRGDASVSDNRSGEVALGSLLGDHGRLRPAGGCPAAHRRRRSTDFYPILIEGKLMTIRVLYL